MIKINGITYHSFEEISNSLKIDKTKIQRLVQENKIDTMIKHIKTGISHSYLDEAGLVKLKELLVRYCRTCGVEITGQYGNRKYCRKCRAKNINLVPRKKKSSSDYAERWNAVLNPEPRRDVLI